MCQYLEIVNKQAQCCTLLLFNGVAWLSEIEFKNLQSTYPQALSIKNFVMDFAASYVPKSFHYWEWEYLNQRTQIFLNMSSLNITQRALRDFQNRVQKSPSVTTSTHYLSKTSWLILQIIKEKLSLLKVLLSVKNPQPLAVLALTSTITPVGKADNRSALPTYLMNQDQCLFLTR